MPSRPKNARPELVVQFAAVAAGIAAAFAPVRLTGDPVVDAVERAVLAALLTYVGAHGRRMSWLIAAALVVVSARGPALAIALAALTGLAASSFRRRRPRDLGAVALAVLVQAPLWYRTDTWIYAPILVVVAFIVVLVSGLANLRTRRRRVVASLGVAVGLFTLVAVAGAVVALVLAAPSVQRGTQAARAALSAARDGSDAGARTNLVRARQEFSLAGERTDTFITRPAALVPGVAQQLRAVHQAIREGSRVAKTGDDLVATADYDSLKYAGRIDVDRMRNLAAPTRRTTTALSVAQRHLATTQEGWLLPPLDDRLRRFSAQLAEAQRDTDLAEALLDVTPTLLGADGPRHYLVVFLTPAELRGAGGFVGSYAELAMTDGKVDLLRSGRTQVLINAVPRGRRTLTGPADYLRRYGRNDPADFIQDATFSPDFPSDASVLAQLYPQSGGRRVDGVIGVDPIGLAALLKLTGPVSVEGLDQPLSEDNAVAILTKEQYLDQPDRAARGEILANATKATFKKLTKASLPAPRRLADVLSGTARSGHLRLWSPNRSQQALFERLGADGSLTLPAGGDGFALVQQNLGNNKLDAYLQRTISYEAEVDARTGKLRARLQVELANQVPSVDLPPAVVDNNRAAPQGTNVATLSVFTRQRVTSAQIDGRPLSLGPDSELGIAVWDTSVIEVPPGRSVTVVFQIEGAVDLRRSYRFAFLPQPVANPDRLTATLALSGGRPGAGGDRRIAVVAPGPVTVPVDRRVTVAPGT